MIELQVTGPISAKKNLLRPRKKVGRDGRQFYYDRELKERLEEIDAELAKQWGSRKPLTNPAIAMIFSVASGRADKDGRATTVLDALVNAGVLRDDCIDLCNGHIILGKAQVTRGLAGCKIFLDPDDDLLAMARFLHELGHVELTPPAPIRGFDQ